MFKRRFTGTGCASFTSLKRQLALLTLTEDNREDFFFLIFKKRKKEKVWFWKHRPKGHARPNVLCSQSHRGGAERSAELYLWGNFKIKDKEKLRAQPAAGHKAGHTESAWHSPNWQRCSTTFYTPTWGWKRRGKARGNPNPGLPCPAARVAELRAAGMGVQGAPVLPGDPAAWRSCQRRSRSRSGRIVPAAGLELEGGSVFLPSHHLSSPRRLPERKGGEGRWLCLSCSVLRFKTNN